ncbi:hypothetical protein [Chlorobium phaeovibrioides]|uniref:Uncharacterized protein n=2 Tax=Chlorobium phaeovibrioides TaxID=1094 RepID=A0ABW9URM3_CHLPH|nr:hypothetical protein [Chlorobium phaeovibrioides]MWV54773.1 hypothetical protein [Chlorobium phaeovibrioides]QEQ56265.1 hypothetical protein FNV82_00120 [Chlorobium phaeovibrioides]HCD35679.1 hypothetical protein [Chlorobium sp.]
MYEELIGLVQQAIDASERWAETGWPVAFGSRNVSVPSLKEAEALPRTAVFRREAVNYWKQVQLTGADAAASGRKALRALKQGDLELAAGALYFCRYQEAPFASSTSTWTKLYDAVLNKAA